MSTYIQNFLKFRPLLSELVSREIMMWGIQNEVYQSDQFAQFGNEFKVDNLSGSVGKAKRLEGIRINILSIPNVNVRYCTHVQDIGWQREKENGQLAGTKGKAKRLEAIKIYLSGKNAVCNIDISISNFYKSKHFSHIYSTVIRIITYIFTSEQQSVNQIFHSRIFIQFSD